MNIKVAMKITVVGFLTVLFGCVNGGDYVTTYEFERMSPNEKEQTLAELREEPTELEEFWKLSLQAYRPVDFPFGGTNYKLKCQWFPNEDYRQLVMYESILRRFSERDCVCCSW